MAGLLKAGVPGVQRVRGPNHVLVSRKTSKVVLRARVRKMIASGRWDEVFIHGLGAAISRAVALAAALVEESDGQLVASCRTSTEALIDHVDEDALDELDDLPDQKTGSIRHTSAIHIALTRRKPPVAQRAEKRS
jgi:DNA-binding protein